MNSNLHKISAAILAIAVTAGFAACTHSRQPVISSSLPSSGADDAGNLQLVYSTDVRNIDLGKIETITDRDGTEFVTPIYNLSDHKIRFLSHWTAETPDSVHMINYMRKYGGPEIEFISAAYPDCGMKLQAMSLADSAPDIYKIRDGDMTGLIRQGVFTDLTNLFDWDNRNWKDLKPYLDSVTYKGQILIAPEMNSNYFIWYNKSIFSDTATSDPIELYNKGEWTLERFDSICRRLTLRENGAVTTYGFGYDHTWLRQAFAFFDAQIVKKQNDTFVNTLGEDSITDAISYLDKMINVSKVTCPQEKAAAYFASGKLAMLWYGNWLTMAAPFDTMNIEGKIDFVPAPENTRTGLGPRQDYAIGGHAIPKGAADIEAATAFIEIFNFYKQTPELDMVSTEAQCRINNWSLEQFRRMRDPRYYENPYTFFEISSTWDFILSSVESNQPWLTVRELYSNQIDLIIDTLSY